MTKKIFFLFFAIFAEINGRVGVSGQASKTTPSASTMLPKDNPIATAANLDKLLLLDKSEVGKIDKMRVTDNLLTPFKSAVDNLNKTLDVFATARFNDLKKFVNTTMAGFKDASDKLVLFLKQGKEKYVDGTLKKSVEKIRGALEWYTTCKIQHAHDNFELITQLLSGNTKNSACFAINITTKAAGSDKILSSIIDKLNKLIEDIKKFLKV